MPSIVCDKLSKQYVLHAGPTYRLGHALRLARPPLLKKFGHYLTTNTRGRSITVLHPFTTRILPGESVAILGRNGSGKSTLLSLLAGILSPTSGSFALNGHVASILELGSGFNEHFSGRNNLQLRAALYGLSATLLEERMDDILAFADIGEFIDEPVSTYSTGMKMRLSFALNTMIDADILIIDEALSVGDAFFQAKCLRWIEDFIAKGRIFLCVSHDIGSVLKLCQRGIVLEKGKTLCEAPIREAVNAYYRAQRGILTKGLLLAQADQKPTETTTEAAGQGAGETGLLNADGWDTVTLETSQRTGDQVLEIIALATHPRLEAAHQVGDWLKVKLRLRAHHDVPRYHLGFGFRDKRGELFGGFHSFYLEEENIQPLEHGEELIATFEVALMMPPGTYLLLVGASENLTHTEWTDFDVIWDAARLTVSGHAQFWGNALMPQRNFQTQKSLPADA